MEEPVPLEQLIATAESIFKQLTQYNPMLASHLLYSKRIDNIRKGEAFDMYGMAELITEHVGKEKWKELRKAWLLHAALRDYRDAQFALAKMYHYETPANNQLAMKWLLKASEQGSAEAMLFIGRMYMKGRGVAIDYKLAMEWFVNALPIKPGSANAYIGELYERGLGVPADRLKALEHYFKSDNDYLSSTARIRKISAEAILNVEKNVACLVKKNEKIKDEKKILKRQAKLVKRKLKSSDRKRRKLEKKVASLEEKVSAAFTLINDLISKQRQQNDTRASSQETTETNTVE